MKNCICTNNIYSNPFTIVCIILLSFFLFSSCEKENSLDLEGILFENKVEKSKEEIAFSPVNAKTITIREEQELANPSNEVDSRSPRTMIFRYRDTLWSDTWTNFVLREEFYADPFRDKLEVEITPIEGDPDLYIYGVDMDQMPYANSYREIRKSITTGIDRETARKTDLMSSEEYIFISVYAYGYSRAIFDIVIYQSPVDCQEYPAASDFGEGVSYDYQPVCGCDGEEYRHRDLAVAAGITSWTKGKCCQAGNCEEIEVELLHIEGEREDTPHVIWNPLTENTLLTTPNLMEALYIQNIFESYAITKFCRVGETASKFTYILSGDNAPEGALNEEDCVRFNSSALNVRTYNGDWVIMEDNNFPIYNFGMDQQAAQKALCLIQKYGFTQQCFVGRPNASFIYLRR